MCVGGGEIGGKEVGREREAQWGSKDVPFQAREPENGGSDRRDRTDSHSCLADGPR